MTETILSQEVVQENNDWRRPFFFIWLGQAFSLIGSSIVQFALVWWMTKTTNSAVVLSTGAFISMLPGIFLAPFAGALVDRWNRKIVMMVADSAIALATLALVYLFWAGSIQIWHIYVLSFLRGLGSTFHWPAMQSSTSLMVPPKHLARVGGVNQALNGVLLIAAPPLGALLVGLMAMHQIMLIDIITAAIAVGSLSLVHIPQPVREAVAVTPQLVLSDMKAGFRYVWNWRGAMMLIVMALLVNFLLTPAFVLLPLLVTRIFAGNQWHLGIINSAWALGMVVGGVVLGAWGGFQRKMVTSLTGLVGMGIGALVVGVAPANLFWIAVGGMVFLGIANPITNGPLHAILQERIAPEMQGRVFTLIQAGANAISPLAMLISGPLAEVLGLRFWYLLSALACVLVGLAARFSTDIMGLDQPRPIQAEPIAP